MDIVCFERPLLLHLEPHAVRDKVSDLRPFVDMPARLSTRTSGLLQWTFLGFQCKVFDTFDQSTLINLLVDQSPSWCLQWSINEFSSFFAALFATNTSVGPIIDIVNSDIMIADYLRSETKYLNCGRDFKLRFCHVWCVLRDISLLLKSVLTFHIANMPQWTLLLLRHL